MGVSLWRKSVVVLIVVLLFAGQGVARADNFIGTSSSEGGTALAGVTSGNFALNDASQANEASTQIYAGAGTGIYLFESDSIVAPGTSAVPAVGTMAAFTGDNADIYTATNITMHVNNDDGTTGAFIVADSNGAGDTVTTLSSENDQTTIAAYTSGTTTVVGQIVVNGSGVTLDGGLNNGSDGITNAGAVSGVTTLTTSGNVEVGGNLDMDGGTISDFLSIGNIAQVQFNANSDGGATDEGFAFIVGDANGDGAGGGVTTETVVYFDENNIALNEDTTVTGNLAVTGNYTSTNGNITLTNGTVSAEQLTSTDDASIADALTVGGLTTLNGGITADGGVFTVADVSGNVHTSGTMDIDGNLDVGNGNFTVTAASGNTAIAGNLSANGATNNIGTTQASANSMGTFAGSTNTIGNTTGVTGITGSAVTINTSDTAALTTTIGSTNAGAGSVTTQAGSSSVTTSTTGTAIVGTTNSVTGTMNINVSNNAATNINTGTTTSAVTIGNAANITSISSATNNIGVNAFATVNNIGTNAAAASTNAIGSTNSSTTVTATGGNSYVSVVNGTASIRSGSGATASGLTTTAVAQTLSSNTATLATELNNSGDANSRANVSGASYVNRLEGDTLINGNTYINGTLVYSSNTAATTNVTSGASVLISPTQDTNGQMAIVNTSGSGVNIDSNGIMTSGIVSQTTGSLVVTNGIGNVHGFAVTEQKATMSGGVHSTSLTLDDTGATFHSTTSDNGAARVTGVADGTSDFDAVNYRQLQQVERRADAGIASVAALAAIPGPVPGKKYSIGGGIGHHNNQDALAIGVASIIGKNKDITVRAGLGYSDQLFTTNAGISWSW